MRISNTYIWLSEKQKVVEIVKEFTAINTQLLRQWVEKTVYWQINQNKLYRFYCLKFRSELFFVDSKYFTIKHVFFTLNPLLVMLYIFLRCIISILNKTDLFLFWSELL